MPSQALYNLAAKGWRQVSGGSYMGEPDQVSNGDARTSGAGDWTASALQPITTEDNVEWAAKGPHADLNTYNSKPLQESRQKREESEDRYLQLQGEHDRILKEARDVIEPHQALNPVTDKQEPAWATSPSRPSARVMSRVSLSAPATPRMSTPRREVKYAPPVGAATPPATARALPHSTSPSRSPMLTASKRTRSRSLCSEDLEVLDQCTFQPNVSQSRRRPVASEPPMRPTKASMLRDEAIWRRRDQQRARALAASPFSSSSTLRRPDGSASDLVLSRHASELMSRQASELMSRHESVQSMCSGVSALTANLTATQQRVLEEKLADEVEEANRAVHRKVDIMLSTRSAHEVRALRPQLNRILAVDQKERLEEAMEERRQQDAESLYSRQESARTLKEERAAGPPRAVEHVREQRALRGMIGRDERRTREEIVHLEEQALLEERRAHVRQMQELEEERARLLQEWRARDIEKKRTQLVELRKRLEDQHQSRKTAEEEEVNEKRAEHKREKARKYEDLLGRAKHLEELRELERALTEQIRNDVENFQAAKDRKIQEAREQAMLEMETRFMEKRHQLLREQDATLERLANSITTTPRRTPRSRTRTPEASARTTPRMTPRSETRGRDPGTPIVTPRGSTKSSISMTSPMSSGDRYRAQKSETNGEEAASKSPAASPRQQQQLAERLMSSRTRTLTTRAKSQSSSSHSRQVEEAFMSSVKSIGSQTSASVAASEGLVKSDEQPADFYPYGSETSFSPGLAAQAGRWVQAATPTSGSPACRRAAVPPLYLASPGSPVTYAQASSPGALRMAATPPVPLTTATSPVPAGAANLNFACKTFSPNARTPARPDRPLNNFSPSVLLPVNGGCSPGSHAGATNGNL